MCNKCKFAIGVSASKRLEPAFEESSSKIGKNVLALTSDFA